VATDPAVMPLADELLACLKQEIEKVDNPPLYVQHRTGAVVDHLLSSNEDECCSGLAWVRVVTFYPSSGTFPAQDETPPPKGITAWAVTLEMGVIRCMPTPSEHSIPTEAQWQAATQANMDDAAAMRRALCCFGELPEGRGRVKNMLPAPWLPIDISGGCTGGVMTVTVKVPACDCAEAGPAS